MIKKNNQNFSFAKGTTVIGKIIKAGQVLYESLINLIVSGIPPLTLSKSGGKGLVDYKIYGESVQDGEPTPDTPIEVESVGERTINLYDSNKQTNISTHTAYIGLDMRDWESDYYTLQIRLKDGKTIPEGVYFGFIFLDTAAYWLISNGSINTAFNGIVSAHIVNGLNGVCCFPNDKLNLILDAFDIFLVKGSFDKNTIPNYEPYGYKIPVKSSGKNLFNDALLSQQANYNTYDKTTGLWTTSSKEGWNRSILYGAIGASGNRDITKLIKVPRNTKITIKFYDYEIITENKTLTCAFYDSNGVITATHQIKAGPIFTLDTPDQECWLDIRRYDTSGTISFSKIQIEVGEIATDYEPYSEPVITNIYLDEPLRKLGNYADYIDFENKKVVRNIGYGEVSSSNTMSIHVNAGTSKSIRISDFNAKALGNEENTCMSNYYMSAMFDPYYNKRTINCCATHSTTNNIIYVHDERFTTVAEYGTFFDECKANGNPVYFAFVNTTPTEETIELPNIPTLKGTTILDANTSVLPSNLEVIYKGKA